MKKSIPFILIIVLVTLACGTSELVNTPTPEFTNTPALTETPIATPTPMGPYANVSSDQAEFWFLLPDMDEEWEWEVAIENLPTFHCGCWHIIDSGWEITIPLEDDSYYIISFVYSDRYPFDDTVEVSDAEAIATHTASVVTQTGSFEEFYKLLENNISIVEGNQLHHLDGDLGMTASISNGGLLIVITNPEILEALNKTKPSVLTFQSPLDANRDRAYLDISPSYGGVPSASIPVNPASNATSTPAVESAVTEPPVTAGQFFTEEFDGDTTNWIALPLRDKAESEKVDFFTEDSALVFDMKGNDGLGTLLTYDSQTYADVRIDAHVENLNNDQGAVSLICRYNGENWYQFFATTTGYYGIYYVFWSKGETNARYQELYNGATDKMVLGPGVNDYSAVCDGKTLSFFINGTEVRTIEETAFNLTSAGQVAIAAYTINKSSFDINFDSVKVSHP